MLFFYVLPKKSELYDKMKGGRMWNLNEFVRE
ncbi:Uncharacterised protein [Streptococcus pneumoniae]|nr:Uncharacterised protein [Streptococcus pneumoniae]